MDYLTVLTPVIAVLLGVLLGHVLSERSTASRERRAEVRQASSVRMLLRLEIDQNLGVVRQEQARVFRRATNQSHPEMAAVEGLSDRQLAQLAMQLIARPRPAWRTTMWLSQAGMLAIAFHADTVACVSEIYGELENLSATHDRLLAIKTNDEAEQRAQPELRDTFRRPMGMRMPAIPEFPSGAPELTRAWIRSVNTLIALGNPVKP